MAPADDAWVRRLAVLAALLVAGCASPAEKVAARLEQAGIPHRQAKCIGDRLAARLSLGQMVELNRVVDDSSDDRLTVDRLITRLGNADPALVAKLIETGIACAI